jgi:hypothetical protein
LQIKIIAFFEGYRKNISNISATILPTRGQTARSDSQNSLPIASPEKTQEMNYSNPCYPTAKSLPKNI